LNFFIDQELTHAEGLTLNSSSLGGSFFESFKVFENPQETWEILTEILKDHLFCLEVVIRPYGITGLME
jgi:hypothetical protein